MNHSPSSQFTPDSPWRVAVVGGGISGLAAAHRLVELCAAEGRPLSLTLFEAGERLGGVVETRADDGYLIEAGADSFITTKPWALELCRRLGLEDELIPTNAEYRRSLVLRGGKPVEVPVGFMLMAPAKVWPVVRSPIFSPLGKLRLGWERFVPANRGDGDESLASFVRRRLGREAWERLVQPLVGGIYTADPERLSLLATLPRFREMEQTHGSLIRGLRSESAQNADNHSPASGARYGMFVSLRGGLAELASRLMQRVAEAGTIHTSTAVSQIEPSTPAEARDSSTDAPQSNAGWRLRLNDDSVHDCDAVIVTVPAYRAANLIHSLDNPLAQLLNRIEYASSAVVITGHKLADVGHPLDAFGLVVPQIENRDILAVSFLSRKFPHRAPGGCVQLRTFVGGALQPELLEQSDDDLVEMVLGELKDIFGVSQQPQLAVVKRYDRAMPQYHVGHLDLVAGIEQRMREHRGLELAGNAYRGVGIPDCVHSGEQAAERLIQKQAAAADTVDAESRHR